MGGANTQQVASKGTRLNPSQEVQFQQWKAVNRPNDSGQDYDLRGAWMAQVKPDGRNHISDEFKFQNHPTFSTGSKYQDAQHQGGEWSNLPNGQTTYEPAKWMEQDKQRMDSLNEYMKREEPNSILIRRAEPAGIKPLPETHIPSVDAYFKNNPQVAAMVTGAGANGMPKEMPAGVQFNPYNTNMAVPANRKSVLANESIRNEMNQSGYAPSFDLPKSQLDWSKELGAYAKNLPALRQTIIARLATGDRVPDATPEEIAEAKKFKVQEMR